MYELRYNGHKVYVVDTDTGRYRDKFPSLEEAKQAISQAEQVAIKYPPENRRAQPEDITPSLKQGLRIFPISDDGFPVE